MSDTSQSPSGDIVVVTPHDTNPINPAGMGSGRYTRALIVGTAGDLAVLSRNGQTVTIPNCPAGVIPIQVSRVLSTGTTAQDITALF